MTSIRMQRATTPQRERQAAGKTALNDAQLSDTQLDAVQGGDAATTSLYKGCVTGKHFPTVTISG